MTTTTLPRTTTRPASDRQVSFIGSLRSQRVLTDAEAGALDAALARGLDVRQASQIITWLSGLPRSAAPAPVSRPRVEVTVGMWLVGDDVRTGRVFKVLPARQSDHLYAKELEGDAFVYVRGALGIVARSGRKMTLEEAKEYGAVTGRCCVCGKLLTDPKSIAAGIGPVCASKF